MVGLANSGAVSLMKSIQNCPAASGPPAPASGSGAARSTRSSTKPYGASRPAHDASAANTTVCPLSSSTLPRPMHWLVGPYADSGMKRTVRPPPTSGLTRARYRRTAPAGYALSVRLLAMTDSLAGPLIVQSDKTLLLEVEHERADDCRQGDRAVRRARAVAGAHPHLPAHAARPVERPRRRARRRAGRRHAARVQPVRRPARAARRRRGDDGALRPAAAGEAPRARTRAGQQRPAGARGGAAGQEGRRAWSAPASTTTPSSSTRASAATSSRRCSSSAGRPRTSPGTSTARRTRSSSTRPSGRCAPTRRRRPSRSGTAAPASSCCPAAPARPWSARPRWPRPRRRR